MDSSKTDKALKSLNGLAVADRKLKVSRATKDQTKAAKKETNSKNKLLPSNHTGSYLGSTELI